MTDHQQLAARTKDEVIAWLRSRGARPGETVEFGWLEFRVCGTPSALDVETLDFEAMASYYTVVLHADAHELIPPDTDISFIDDFEQDRPWWKFW